MKQTISKATIDRLPLYYRCLRLAQDDGMDIISSEELGRRLELTPEQIRKDLALFGELTPEQIRKDLALFGQFGKKGVGYYVNELKFNVGKILGLDNHWNIAIVGIGHLGVALANYQNFIALGFNLVALFDNDPSIIGKTVNHVRVRSIDDLPKVAAKLKIDIGVIAVPAQFAQSVADRLIKAKIKGIWNFAPIKMKVPNDVKIVNEDLSVGLSRLSYYITGK